MSQSSSSSTMAQGISTTHRPVANTNNHHHHAPRPSAAAASRGSPIQRPVFRSQIPIRARYGPPLPSTPHNTPPRSLVYHHPHAVRPAARIPSSDVHPAVAVSLAENKTAALSIERGFKVFAEGLESDLRDFRGLCIGLVVHEQHEKEKWYSLCMKIMKERDMARQRVDELVQEREDIGIPTNEMMIERVPGANGGPKRGREEGDVEAGSQENKSDAGSDKAQRPVRSLRGPSPTVSPPGSPSYPVYTTHLPPSPTSRSCSLPPKPGNPKNIPPPDLSVKSTSSAPATITTFPVDQPHAYDIAEPPLKRRKSCDTAISHPSSSSTAVETENWPLQNVNGGKQHTRTPRPPVMAMKSSSVIAPGEFCHVDLMYLQAKGALTCRACLLNTSKPTASGNAPEPKSFPMSASWDELRDHCVKEHPDACADVARLHPAEIFELRKRLSLSN
ncbi:unnamed protein product [Cyclocybe aegerita]|uniref:Uncharacterized protein n=1 Tax=Cyclocybe aegerita TaxID=1973307 RepID=A0A8S0WG76_CYCAE|nr:unnamed protein product [Cyclocybe aegerita]